MQRIFFSDMILFTSGKQKPLKPCFDLSLSFTPGSAVPGNRFKASCPVRRGKGRWYSDYREGGGGSLEGSAGCQRRTQGGAGGHSREVPLLYHGARPDGLDGEHHPADRDPGEAQVIKYVRWGPSGLRLAVLDLSVPLTLDLISNPGACLRIFRRRWYLPPDLPSWPPLAVACLL